MMKKEMARLAAEDNLIQVTYDPPGATDKAYVDALMDLMERLYKSKLEDITDVERSRKVQAV